MKVQAFTITVPATAELVFDERTGKWTARVRQMPGVQGYGMTPEEAVAQASCFARDEITAMLREDVAA